MIFKIKIKNKRKKNDYQIYIWIEQHKDFEEEITQLFRFFKNDIEISRVRKYRNYYKVTSKNPSILLSLLSTINDLIPEIYFINES